MDLPLLPRPALRRVVASLLRDVAGEEATVGKATPQEEQELALDSIDLVEAAGRANQMFHLHETGLEDYLLARRTLGAWCDIVEQAWAEGGVDQITFLTSGTTGEPKPCTHAFATLEQEAGVLAELFEDRERIVALAPAHHIYGFLFTALLPGELGVPAADATSWPAARLKKELRRGDLVVTFPLRWRYLARSLPHVPEGVAGVTSTAPCEAALIERLREQGLKQMTEVYGSSETGGVGYRRRPQDPYELFPHWQRVAAGGAGNADASGADASGNAWLLARVHPDGSRGPAQAPMDRLEWQGERAFRPVGRRDGAVQVAGTNVVPGEVAAQLREHPRVAQATVRLADSGGTRRLEATITPAAGTAVEGGGLEALRRDLSAWARQHLPAAARPHAFVFEEGHSAEEEGRFEKHSSEAAKA